MKKKVLQKHMGIQEQNLERCISELSRGAIIPITKIIVNKYMEEGLPLNELLMAEEVMKVHYSNMVGLIPLSKTLHLMVHGENAEKVVIPAYMIFGNYKKFIEEYGDYMNDEDFKKIERLIQRTKEIKESDYKFLEQHYDYIEVDGFKIPERIESDAEKAVHEVA